MKEYHVMNLNRNLVALDPASFTVIERDNFEGTRVTCPQGEFWLQEGYEQVKADHDEHA